MDLSPEWRNGGGPTFLESMQVLSALMLPALERQRTCLFS